MGQFLVFAISIMCCVVTSCSVAGDTESSTTLPREATPDSGPSKFSDLLPNYDYQRLAQATEVVAARLAAGDLDRVDRLLSFNELAAWEYVDGLQGIPPEVRGLNGLRVAMVGYLLQEEVGSLSCLVVESGTMWHMQTLSVNRGVRAVMTTPPDAALRRMPVMIVGDFRVRARVRDGWCVDIYQVDVDHIELVSIVPRSNR
ncbi:MAG: hypothetical protein ACI89X_003566 [Planctomycetota bacterium]|jgi:hypothetical protein